MEKNQPSWTEFLWADLDADQKIERLRERVKALEDQLRWFQEQMQRELQKGKEYF